MADLTQYTWEGIPQIVFNSTTDPDNFYRLQTYLPDTFIRNIEDEKPNADGIIDYDSSLGKGLFRLQVDIFASTLAKRNLMIANLKKSFNPRLLQLAAPTDADIADGGYAPLTWTEERYGGDIAVRVMLKPLEIPKIIKSEHSGSGVSVVILLKAKDPWMESQTAKTITGADDSTNDGDMPAYPIITITGDTGANPKVTYHETGEYIQIDDNMTGSDVYIIDCGKATVTKNGSNAYQYLNSGSTFFMIQSGVVTIDLADTGTAVVTVVFRDTYTL